MGTKDWVEARYTSPRPTVKPPPAGPRCQPCPLKLSFDVLPEGRLEDTDFGSCSAEELVHIFFFHEH